MTTELVELVRFFFVLPEPVALPDGFQFNLTFSEGPTQPDDPHVQVTFRQAEVQGGRMTSSVKALQQVIGTAPALPQRRTSSESFPGVKVQHTVVDAVTAKDSPDSIPASAYDPARWTPRQDALSRCVATAERAMRAHRQATEATYGLLSYVRLVSPVFAYSAQGTRDSVVIDGITHVFTRPVEEWSGPSIILLDHSNLADPFMGPEWNQDIAQRFHFWLLEQERGNPLNLWRERFIESKRALSVTGDLAQAVSLANTSCEVLLDVVLALLHWEEQIQIEVASLIFEEGKVLRRVTKDYPSRLKGTWSTDSGSVGEWYENAYRLRHRIVHAGYSPTAAEAQCAFESAINLQGFLWDRLATQKAVYPRSALMTLGIEGLKNRDLWSRKIRLFSEEIAPHEPNWRDSFSDYYHQVMSAVLTQQHDRNLP